MYRTLFFLAACALALSCVAVAQTRPLVQPKVSRPNVVFITVDTLRADHLGCYGATQVKTPALDGLAADGVVFERAISQVPLTWPSHAAMLTGTYPFQNGVQDFTGHPLSPQFRSVAQAFKDAGYTTGAVVSSFVLDRSWGLARGFDYYDDAFSAEAFKTKDIGLVDRKAGESLTHALAWLNRTPKRPFFFWLHLYDPHSPYDPPEPYRTEYSSHPYDGEIAYADHQLARLFAWLKTNRLYESTLIVFTSDHGESLGEHGEAEHGFFVYNSTVHVPLIVKPAGKLGVRPKHVAAPVEIISIAPTLLALAGIKDNITQQFSAAELLGLGGSGDDQRTPAAYSETFYPFSSFGWSPLHGLETPRYHYIDAPQPELYDLTADPAEKNNLAAQQPATVSVLKQKVQELIAQKPFSAEAADTGNLSPDAQEKLRALGYFGFHAAVSDDALKSGLADPKDKIGEFNTILKAEDAFHRGDDSGAETLLRAVQQQDPKIYVIPYMLGESALRRQDWETARDQLQRCLDLNPGFDNAMTGLARALSKLGRIDEAKSWLQKAVQINPQNYRAWYESGLLEAGSNPTQARSDYEKAIAIQPNYSPGQRELGLALFQAKDYSGCVIHLEKAIALGIDDAHIRNFLGICYSQTNRPQKSVASYHAAIKLDPNLAEAHLNLAYELKKLGHVQQAQVESAAACRLDPKFCGLLPR